MEMLEMPKVPFGNTTAMPGMQMTFYSSNMVTILWEGWTTSGPCTYWLTLLGLFVAGILYEALSLYRVKVDSSTAVTPKAHSSSYQLIEEGACHSVNELSVQTPPAHHTETRLRYELKYILRGFIFFTQLFFGYLIMLAVMTFNYGVFFSIILGRAIGYYLLIRLFNTVLPNEEVCH